MPAYGGRLTEAEAWKIVAYVRSLGGNTVAPPRNDEMQAMRGATGGMSGPLPSPSDRDVLRAAEDEALGRYAWVDRKAGVVRIPIERAMELLTRERSPLALHAEHAHTRREVRDKPESG